MVFNTVSFTRLYIRQAILYKNIEKPRLVLAI